MVGFAWVLGIVGAIGIAGIALSFWLAYFGKGEDKAGASFFFFPSLIFFVLPSGIGWVIWGIVKVLT